MSLISFINLHLRGGKHERVLCHHRGTNHDHDYQQHTSPGKEAVRVGRLRYLQHICIFHCLLKFFHSSPHQHDHKSALVCVGSPRRAAPQLCHTHNLITSWVSVAASAPISRPSYTRKPTGNLLDQIPQHWKRLLSAENGVQLTTVTSVIHLAFLPAATACSPVGG